MSSHPAILTEMDGDLPPMDTYERLCEEYFALFERKEALEAEHDEEALADNREYRHVVERIEAVWAEMDAIVARVIEERDEVTFYQAIA